VVVDYSFLLIYVYGVSRGLPPFDEKWLRNGENKTVQFDDTVPRAADDEYRIPDDFRLRGGAHGQGADQGEDGLVRGRISGQPRDAGRSTRNEGGARRRGAATSGSIARGACRPSPADEGSSLSTLCA